MKASIFPSAKKLRASLIQVMSQPDRGGQTGDERWQQLRAIERTPLIEIHPIMSSV
jgi:hypothetical protein